LASPPQEIGGCHEQEQERPQSLHVYAGMAAEQRHQNKNEHDQPNQAVTTAPVVTAATAEQKNKDDEQKEQAHGTILIGECARS
jgi:hypothetical protein